MKVPLKSVLDKSYQDESNFLDIIPENEEEQRMIVEFLSNFQSRKDFERVAVSWFENGLLIEVM